MAEQESGGFRPGPDQVGGAEGPPARVTVVSRNVPTWRPGDRLWHVWLSDGTV